MMWLVLAVVGTVAVYLAGRYRLVWRRVPGMPIWLADAAARLFWIGAGLLVVAGVLGGIGQLLLAYAQEGPAPAYTTPHPGKNEPWLGLATQSGRYEVLLGDGCDGIGQDTNVLLDSGDDSNEAQWTLQLMASDQVCSVAEWHWMGNTPCSTNEAGDCDVSNA